MSESDIEAAKRRDFRNAKDAPEAPRHRGKRTKSCKRSPDKIHTFEATEARWDNPGFTWVDYRCVYCGKRDLSLR